jgi:membrane protein
VFGPQAGDAIQTMLVHAKEPGAGVLGTIIGAVVLLFGASGVFGELQDAMNTIWEVSPKPGRGVVGIVKDRFLSFTMVLGVAFMLLVSLVISAALSALGDWMGSFVDVEWLWQGVNLAVSLALITLLFALVFKVVPDVKIRWGDVWLGAAVTAVLFTIGKFLIGLYVGKAGVASPYGAAGSLVVIVVWVFYSAHILFVGAEFTQVYARAMGVPIEPARGAIAITEEARAEQGIPHSAHS